MSNEIEWMGVKFKVLAKDVTWADRSGVYIFTGVAGGRWQPYYIGQAASFSDRIPSHERWDGARRLGATHVHAVVVSDSAERDRLEAQLIKAFQPQLNELLK